MADTETLVALIRRSLDAARRSRLTQIKGPGVSSEAMALLTGTNPAPKPSVLVPLTFVLEALSLCGIDANGLQISLGAEVEARSPSFGVVLKTIRDEQKMTQTALAEKSGVAASSIIQYEAGRRSPSLAVAAKLAKALGVGLDRFADCDFGED